MDFKRVGMNNKVSAEHLPVVEETGKPQEKRRKKSDMTREKILAAALRVFGTYPYHRASFRMIGTEAGIEHPLINYYFPSKSDLFRALVTGIQSRRVVSLRQWFNDIRTLDPVRGFAVFLDKVLDDYHRYPDGYRLVALNIVQTRDAEQVPAIDVIKSFLEEEARIFAEIIRPPVPEFEIEMFIRSFSTLVISFLGASSSYAAMQNLDPDGIQYLNWVKDAITYALLPRLEKMLDRT